MKRIVSITLAASFAALTVAPHLQAQEAADAPSSVTIGNIIVEGTAYDSMTNSLNGSVDHRI